MIRAGNVRSRGAEGGLRLFDTSTRELLQRLGSATLHEAQGRYGALPPGIRPVAGPPFLVGSAFTVRARPGDNLALHHALALANPGDVLVIDCGGFEHAGVWGEVMTVSAIVRKLGGLVVDGAVRDIAQINTLGFPVFSRGISMVGTSKGDSGILQETLHWDGASIEPGDLVGGDLDGIVVIKQGEVETVISAALEREKNEQKMMQQLANGATTIEVMNLPRP